MCTIIDLKCKELKNLCKEITPKICFENQKWPISTIKILLSFFIMFKSLYIEMIINLNYELKNQIDKYQSITLAQMRTNWSYALCVRIFWNIYKPK